MITELPQDWGNRLSEGTNTHTHTQNPVCTRSQEKKAVSPQETVGLACECQRVSSGGMGQWWPASGLEALSVSVYAWDLLKEVAFIFITSTIVWPQVNSREETQLHPSTDLLSRTPPIRTRPSFPHSQSLPSGRVNKPLVHVYHRADTVKTTVTEN